MEEFKVCFCCLLSKKLSDFYKHSGMKDGCLNKCKECIKKDVIARYEKNILNNEYVEKERARGRIKYHKYKYKNNIIHNEGKNTRSYLKSKNIEVMDNEEFHHWNYNMKNNVFVLNRRAHSLIHKYITFDEESKMFYTKSDNYILDTAEKHLHFIKTIFDFKKVKYEVKHINI